MLLFCTILCLKWNTEFLNYTDEDISKYMRNKEEKKSLFLYFGNSDLKKHRKLIEILNMVCDEANMYTKFGYVDVDYNLKITKYYGINTFPSIILFTKKGPTVYKGEVRVNSILRFIVSNMEKNIFPIDEKWSISKDNYIALFHKTFVAPPCFIALSSQYIGTNIKFGFASSEEIFDIFGVNSTPQLLISKKGIQQFVPDFAIYNLTFSDLQTLLIKYFPQAQEEL